MKRVIYIYVFRSIYEYNFVEILLLVTKVSNTTILKNIFCIKYHYKTSKVVKNIMIYMNK